MRKLLLLLFAIFSVATFGSKWVGISSTQPVDAGKTLVSSDIQTSKIYFSLQGYEMTAVKTPKGTQYIIGVGNGTPMLVKNAPDLAKITASVIIPDKDQMEVRVVSSSYKDFTNIEVAPSKGNLYRDIDPATVPFNYGKTYSEDAFYPGKLAELHSPYILRDYRGQTVIIYPFQYNPVTKVLRVYTDITVEMYSTGKKGENILIRNKNRTTVNGEFQKIYKRQFLNTSNTKYTPVDEQGKMLVISYGDFMPAMQPFVNWKNQEGIETEMVNVSTIGTTASAIKTYIADYYNANDLAYVLLVGDAAQIPTNDGSGLGGPSDNAYGYILGNDHYPELFVGRFSAENLTHVQTQVQKVLTYEVNPPTSTDWFSTGIGIGSDQGPGDDNEYDYQHIRNIRTKLMGYTYTAVSELYDGNQGGLDEPGSPGPTDVATEVNAGASIINYTGHGSDISWGTTGFSNSDVTALTNDNILPFIWSVACVNGNFPSQTCFAEAWLRATHNGQPSGAVATLMSTINQSWNPPMEGSDQFNDILSETYQDNIKRTFGGISMNGCMGMNDAYGAEGDEMTDTWNLFGDPSLMVRTAMPQAINASHTPTIFLGSAQFSVTADAEGGVVALSIGNQFLAKATITGGVATLDFPALTALDTLHVVITAFNKLPYIANVPIIPAEGPYVTYNSFTVNDANGNNNGVIDFGENIAFSISLKNVGVEIAQNVTATLSTTNPYITITDDNEAYGNIEAGQTTSITDGFAFTVADSISDQLNILFTLTMTDGTDTWTSNFSAIANAPVLAIGNLSIDDAAGGNGNGRLDPGETATLAIAITNNGHSDAQNTLAQLTSSSQYITINTGNADLGTLTSGQTADAVFNITASANALIGSVSDFICVATSEVYETQQTFFRPIGLILEDWESGDFSQYGWTQGGDAPWTITSVSPYEGVYSVKSGAIGDNQSSELTLVYNVMSADSISFYRKVSSEATYDFLRFYIDGVEKGSWSDVLGWERFAYPVAAGQHTFKWEYSKDITQTGGEDAAWIDYIVLPPALTTTAYAGADATVCEGSDYQCNATATNYASVLWATSGTGTFSDAGILNPVYTPSQADIDAGNVALTITAYGNSRTDATDQMTLVINKATTVAAGEDAAVCQNQPFTLSGASSNYSAIRWTSSGTGLFNDPALLNAVYTPSAEDYAAGSITLTLTAYGIAPCGDITDDMILTFSPLPGVPGTPTSASNRICQDSPDTEVTTTSIANATSYSWNMVPAEAGTITGNSLTATIQWNADYFGKTGISVKAINDCGEGETSASYEITVVPFPLAPEKPMGIDSADMAYVTSSEFKVNKAMHALSYGWNIDPSEAGTIAGTDTLAVITWNTSFVGAANISVKAINSCGESVYSELKTVKIYSTIGINENSNQIGVNVYPNPNNGTFTVELNAQHSGKVNLRLANALGETVYQQNNLNVNGKQKLMLNLPSLNDGAYYFFVENNDFRQAQKIIIQK